MEISYKNVLILKYLDLTNLVNNLGLNIYGKTKDFAKADTLTRASQKIVHPNFFSTIDQIVRGLQKYQIS